MNQKIRIMKIIKKQLLKKYIDTGLLKQQAG